jgi:hypothetical protein
LKIWRKRFQKGPFIPFEYYEKDARLQTNRFRGHVNSLHGGHALRAGTSEYFMKQGDGTL